MRAGLDYLIRTRRGYLTETLAAHRAGPGHKRRVAGAKAEGPCPSEARCGVNSIGAPLGHASLSPIHPTRCEPSGPKALIRVATRSRGAIDSKVPPACSERGHGRIDSIGESDMISILSSGYDAAVRDPLMV